MFSYAMPFGWRGGSIVILDLLVLVNSQKYGSVVLSKEMLRSELFKGLGWIEHGFGTRLSQVSQDGMASLDQIHSAKVLRTEQVGRAGIADALVTATPGLAISIRTADCLPILLVDRQHRAVAAVHAGWRGSADEIVRRTLDRMREEFETAPDQIIAAIGPGIGKCCYQVGDEVARKFGLNGAGRVDLAAANRQQLIMDGVPAGQIDTVGPCTMCNAEQFHSYRRDGEAAGRMISFVRMQNRE